MSTSDLVIRELKPGVWIFSRPFARVSVIPFGGRSTAIKMNDGSVFLFASTKADEETVTKIKEIGPVRYILAPDVEHYLNLYDFSQAFPEAKLIGVQGLEEKVPGVKFTGIYGKDPEGTLYGFEDEVDAVYFGAFRNKDVALFHKASKTLIEADLLLNLPAVEQYSKSKESGKTWLPGLGSLHPFTWAHKAMISSVAKDVKANSVSAKAVDAWDFDTIVPCHGDVIDHRAKEAWADVWAKYLV